MQPRELVADRFEIDQMVGRGGMGAIYKAIDSSTGAAVALKLLRRSGLKATTRFSREAWLLSELTHPGIVGYVAHGETTAGSFYLAMEWLEGEDLGTRLT